MVPKHVMVKEDLKKKKKNRLLAKGNCYMGTGAKIEKCGCNLWLCILSDQPKSQNKGLKKWT